MVFYKKTFWPFMTIQIGLIWKDTLVFYGKSSWSFLENLLVIYDVLFILWVRSLTSSTGLLWEALLSFYAKFSGSFLRKHLIKLTSIRKINIRILRIFVIQRWKAQYWTPLGSSGSKFLSNILLKFAAKFPRYFSAYLYSSIWAPLTRTYFFTN